MTRRRDSLPAELVEDVKAYLGITWQDDITDRRIGGLIGAGMAYIDSKYGGEADYDSDGLPRSLLFEYVRYARDSALDVFENNYTPMILAMQHERRVHQSEELQTAEP